MFNDENFLCRLSWSVSSDFSTIHSWRVRKIHWNFLFLRFKVVQGRPCWYPRKAHRQCLLYRPICNRSHARRLYSGKMKISSGVPLLTLLFEGYLLTLGHEIWSQKTRDCAILWWKPGVSILPEIGLVMGLNKHQDRQTNGQTDRPNYYSYSTRLALLYVLSCLTMVSCIRCCYFVSLPLLIFV